MNLQGALVLDEGSFGVVSSRDLGKSSQAEGSLWWGRVGVVTIAVGSKRRNHGFKLRSTFIPEKCRGIQMGGEQE